MDIKDQSYKLRELILVVAQSVNELHNHKVFKAGQEITAQHSEMHANITLAYRHLEDARMRLGKVVQAYDGGTSCYSK